MDDGPATSLDSNRIHLHFNAAFGAVDEPLASGMLVHFLEV